MWRTALAVAIGFILASPGSFMHGRGRWKVDVCCTNTTLALCFGLPASILTYSAGWASGTSLGAVGAGLGFVCGIRLAYRRHARLGPILAAAMIGSLLASAPTGTLAVLGLLSLLYWLVGRGGWLTTLSAIAAPLAMYWVERQDLHTVFLLILLFVYWTSAEGQIPPIRHLARTWRLVLYACLLLAVLGAAVTARYAFHAFGLQTDVFRQGPGDLPVIALTFDDGPSPQYTDSILDILAEEDVKATFFLVGRQVEKYPSLARRIVADGHCIGSHTYSYVNLLGASPQRIESEIEEAEAWRPRDSDRSTCVHPEGSTISGSRSASSRTATRWCSGLSAAATGWGCPHAI